MRFDLKKKYSGYLLLVAAGIQLITVLMALYGYTFSQELSKNSPFAVQTYVWMSVWVAILSIVLIIGTYFFWAGKDSLLLKHLNSQTIFKKFEGNETLLEEAKTIFLDRISHEMKTPLNVITGISEIGLRDPDYARSKDYFRNILAASEHLLTMMNEVFDLSKMKRGMIVLTEDRIDLPQLMQDVENLIRARMRGKNKKIVFFCNGPVSTRVIGDRYRLQQILLNLLDNAVKFTSDDGAIHLRANWEQREAMTVLSVTVEDNGIGIPEALQSGLFSNCDQFEIGDCRNTAGMGLAITKYLIEQMGGEIQLQSVLGEGSSFSFYVNLRSYDARVNASDNGCQNAIPDEKKVSVLVVDDVEMNLMIVRELLLEYGICVEAAGSGQEALDKFLSSDLAYYQLIFMDIQMPDMDGYETTKRIRGTGYGNAMSIPIYALSANTAPENVLYAKGCGMNGYIMKPVSADQLMQVIHTIA